MASFNILWNNNSTAQNDKMTQSKLNNLLTQNVNKTFGITGLFCAAWVFSCLESVGIVLPRADAWNLFTAIKDMELRFGKDGQGMQPFEGGTDQGQLSTVRDGLIFGYFQTSLYQNESLAALSNASTRTQNLVKKTEGRAVGMTHVGIMFNGNLHHWLGNQNGGGGVYHGLVEGFKPVAWWPVIDELRKKLPTSV